MIRHASRKYKLLALGEHKSLLCCQIAAKSIWRMDSIQILGGLSNHLGGIKNESFNSLDEALIQVINIDKHRIKRHYSLVEPSPIYSKKLLLLRLIESLNKRFGMGKVKLGTNEL